MKRTKVKYVVRRTYESTVAIVEADVTVEVALTLFGFKTVLTTALTNWFHTSDGGRAAFQEASYDFNIGDLATIDLHRTPELQDELRQFGIENLLVKVIVPKDADNPDDWTFDEILEDQELVQVLKEQKDGRAT